LDEIKNYLVYRNTIPNASACLFRKSFANFPKELNKMKFSGDWLFWINLLAQGTVGYTPCNLNYFCFHQQTSRRIKNNELERKRMREYF
jgi:hypothetical protein